MDSSFFVFNDTATTEIYTLSLHDALPISPTTHSTRPCGWSPRERVETFDRSTNGAPASAGKEPAKAGAPLRSLAFDRRDRKSTRLNSSHLGISYAVFCLKKKNKGNRSSPD